jgi:hypothetical protein
VLLPSQDTEQEIVVSSGAESLGFDADLLLGPNFFRRGLGDKPERANFPCDARH